MAKTITLKEAQASYATVIEQVKTAGEPLVIEQDGRPFAVVIPFAEYQQLVALRESERKAGWQEEQHHLLMQEQAAFERMKSKLLQTHKDKWVAILDGQLVDSDEDDGILAKRVYAKYGYRTMLITEVRDEPRVWEFSSPETVR